jgi:hypothetical protein
MRCFLRYDASVFLSPVCLSPRLLFYFKILSIIGNVKEIISSLLTFLTNNFSIISSILAFFIDNFSIILRLNYLTIR